jgi:serine/threonine protein kinase
MRHIGGLIMPSEAKAFQWSDFEMVQMLGEGHAGVVTLAKLKRPIANLSADHLVAIKQYKTWVLEEAGQFERIIRELETGRKLCHPNLVQTISIIRDNNGNPALVMQYYPGKTLAEYLEEKRQEDIPIDLEFAFQIILDIAYAIKTLHEAGAIHRDVKPANIILSKNGPILMDLGVVKSQDFSEQTTKDAFLGTIRYAAPEYLFAEDYDNSIDIYSLGAIIYELFRGKPFLYDNYQFFWRKKWDVNMVELPPPEEVNWAGLIAMIDYLNKLGVIVKQDKIRQHYNADVVEFVEFLINRTTTRKEHRILNLNRIIDLLKGRTWDKPFHLVKETEWMNDLVLGYPPLHLLGRIGDWDDYPLVPFEEAMTDLMKVLPDSYKKILHDVCEKLSLGEKTELPGGAAFSYFLNCGIFRFPKENEGFQIHPTVHAAYRYGYL